MKRHPWLIAFLVGIIGCDSSQSISGPDENGLFPIIDAPSIESVSSAVNSIQDDELVLGVIVSGEARAYPINMLTGPTREIINDELGGIAIAATW